jgi:hypothetical protein
MSDANKKSISKALLFSAAVVLSLFLSLVSWVLYDKVGMRTPCIVAAEILAPPSHSAFSGVGSGLRVQFIVDWLFWLTLMCLLYWFFRRLHRRRS